jgi:hypothetical protein
MAQEAPFSPQQEQREIRVERPVASESRRALPLRNIHVGSLLETFLVAAVLSILGIRVFLELTGYPQLGGNGLHIAHMLWGGLGMLIALILLLAFLGYRVQVFSAFLGGIGFGFFIDELGKFITSDNNYFFQPTLMLIYILFILLFLGVRGIEQYAPLSKEERLANTLDMLKESLLHRLHPEQKTKVLALLDAGDQQDQRLRMLTRAVEQMEVVPAGKPSVLTRGRNAATSLYQRVVHSRQFARFIIAGLTVYALFFVGYLLVLVLSSTRQGNNGATSSVEACLWLSSAVAGVLLVIGTLTLRHSRLQAYHWFRRSILVSLLLVDVFAFYFEQLGALGGVVVHLVILAVLNALIAAEQQVQH